MSLTICQQLHCNLHHHDITFNLNTCSIVSGRWAQLCSCLYHATTSTTINLLTTLSFSLLPCHVMLVKSLKLRMKTAKHYPTITNNNLFNVVIVLLKTPPSSPPPLTTLSLPPTIYLQSTHKNILLCHIGKRAFLHWHIHHIYVTNERNKHIKNNICFYRCFLSLKFISQSLQFVSAKTLCILSPQ